MAAASNWCEVTFALKFANLTQTLAPTLICHLDGKLIYCPSAHFQTQEKGKYFCFSAFLKSLGDIVVKHLARKHLKSVRHGNGSRFTFANCFCQKEQTSVTTSK